MYPVAIFVDYHFFVHAPEETSDYKVMVAMNFGSEHRPRITEPQGIETTALVARDFSNSFSSLSLAEKAIDTIVAGYQKTIDKWWDR